MGCMKVVNFLTLHACFFFIGGHFIATEYPSGIRAIRSPHVGQTLSSVLAPIVNAFGVLIWG